MAARKKPKAWNVKPQMTAARDLWRGCVHALPFWPGALNYDIAQRRYYPVTGTLANRLTPSGLAGNFDGTNTRIALGMPHWATVLSEISVFAYVIPDVFGSDNTIFREDGGAASQFDLDINDGTEIRWYTQAGTLTAPTSDYTAGQPMTISGSVGRGGLKLFINAEKVGESAGGTISPVNNGIYVGAENLAADEFDGAMMFLSAWSRDLTDDEQIALHKDPFAMIRPAGF